MSTTVSFAGTISKVTADGSAAVVTLSTNVNGRSLAVISSDTTGRSRIVNKQGRLQNGSQVVGLAKPGPDALKVVEVSLATK